MADTKSPEPAVRPEVVIGPADPDRGDPTVRLKGVLVLVSIAALVLAGYLYYEHRQSRTERDAAQAVAAYTAALNAHDAAAVTAAMAPGASFAAGENLERPLVTAQVGPQLDGLLGSLFSAGVSLETTGRVVVVGDDNARASVAQRIEYDVYGLHVVEDGMSLYSLVRVDGVTKVAQHVWWRPQAPAYPSILWTRCSSALEPTCQ